MHIKGRALEQRFDAQLLHGIPTALAAVAPAHVCVNQPFAAAVRVRLRRGTRQLQQPLLLEGWFIDFDLVWAAFETASSRGRQAAWHREVACATNE